MKHLFVCFCLLFFSSVLRAQVQDFPQSWEGDWKGKVTLFSAKGTHSVPVHLTIRPLDASRWSWTLYYEAPGQEPRNYELVQDKTGWSIDEKNGIVLPQQLIGNRLASSFSVAGSLLICYYWLEKEVLHMEIHTVGQQGNTPDNRNGKEPAVSNHSVGTFQKAELYRK